MDKFRQELMQVARKKLARGQYPVEQREMVLRTLDLMLELARYDEKNEENARSAARLFANITHHHNLLAIIQQQANELNALKRITYNLTSSLHMQVILDAIVAEAIGLIKYARVAHIYLLLDGQLKFGASIDSEGNRNSPIYSPRPNGLTYTVARTKQTYVIDNISKHPLYENAPSDWTGGIVGIPLMTGETILGVMNMGRWSTDGFQPSELRLLGLLADQAALAIINARLHEAVASQAMSDALTGLPNRRALDIRLEENVQRAARYERQFAVIMMDLDGFKAINDQYGHGTGDQILRQYAQFITSAQRASDFLARYGGDELLMLLPETGLDAAQHAAEHIRDRMSGFEFTLPDGNKYKLTVSGGIAIFPTHATSAADLLRAADETLYRAKRHARGSFLVAEMSQTGLGFQQNVF